MRRAAFLGLFLVLGLACQPLPPPGLPPGSLDPQAAESCSSFYPKNSFRAIHALDISLPYGRHSAVIGITIADLISGRLRATLLSLEGLVLFDATSVNGITEVHRALPPLDTGSFAENLITDVKFLFRPPEAATLFSVSRKNGAAVCRRVINGKEIFETVSEVSQNWIIRHYNEKGKLIREATASGPVPPDGFPQKMQLHVYNPGGDYSLSLELVEEEFIEPSDLLFEP